MLKYFFESSDYTNVKVINDLINSKKKRLNNGDLTDPFFEIEQSKVHFEEIKEKAIKLNNEKMANAQYVVKLYLELFCKLADYFKTIKSYQYKRSWDILQDCFDVAICIGKFVPVENRYEIPALMELLTMYEGLYPYKVFGSSEFVINKSHCSICGLPMQSLECPHIKGELYWGDMAVEIVDNIITFQAICLVSHPLDKRCILELADDTRCETEKFKMLNEFISLNLPFLQMFNMKTRKEYRKRDDIKIVGPNERCPCGSGKKFKKCCGKTLYYEHLHCMVTPLNPIELIML